jgi:predicted DNA-binding transcriptional regulator YafY
MLNNVEIKKIEDFVYSKPRSIQEIAEHLDVSWRTADRYIEEIQKDYGTVSTRVFREGTRGALKIVFWSSVEKISSSIFQEKLEEEIMRARRKEDFSAFDIFQHVQDKYKSAEIQKATKEEETDIENLAKFLSSAEKQILVFSGNLSFANLKNKKYDLLEILDKLVKKGVSIKIICRVDLAGRENIEKILSLNFKNGKELIEIHHKEHPIRAFIIDGKIFRIKEIKEPTGRTHELDKKIFIFYTIKDKDWTEWLSKIFWKIFSQSIDVNKRIEELKKLR